MLEIFKSWPEGGQMFFAFAILIALCTGVSGAAVGIYNLLEKYIERRR